jgi:hypothetical protein
MSDTFREHLTNARNQRYIGIYSRVAQKSKSLKNTAPQGRPCST